MPRPCRTPHQTSTNAGCGACASTPARTLKAATSASAPQATASYPAGRTARVSGKCPDAVGLARRPSQVGGLIWAVGPWTALWPQSLHLLVKRVGETWEGGHTPAGGRGDAFCLAFPHAARTADWESACPAWLHPSLPARRPGTVLGRVGGPLPGRPRWEVKSAAGAAPLAPRLSSSALGS